MLRTSRRISDSRQTGPAGRRPHPTAASTAARTVVPAAAKGRMAAPTSAEIEPSGQMTNCLEEPSRTETSVGKEQRVEAVYGESSASSA
jgi:hypothetical protein